MHAHHQAGALNLHLFSQTPGIERVITQEHVIFLVDSPATTTEIWEGLRQPQRHWEPEDLAFMPALTELRSAGVSNKYAETMIRLPVAVFESAVQGDIDPRSLDMRYTKLKNRFGMTRH